jgi:hypothetical protein
MYDPLALDRLRIEQERLRHRAESAPRRPEPDESVAHDGRRLRVPRRLQRRATSAC